MNKYTFTPEQLSDIIDRAFDLGKIYAADELQSAGYTTGPTRKADGFLGTHAFLEEWNKWIETSGGVTLNSGDAKLDILFDAVKGQMRNELAKVIDY